MALALLPVMATAGLAQQLGRWTPWTASAALLVGLGLAVVVLPRLRLRRLPWSTTLVLLGLAAGFGLWAALTHGEHVVVRRDPGAYATYALALARFGGVPLDPGLEAFGLSASDPWVRVSAAANYATTTPLGPDAGYGLRVVPQFLVGVPALLSGGWWLAGWTGVFALPALVGTLALAAFGALAAHLLGRAPAVLAVVLLGLAQPVLLVLRQTFSEPFSLLYLLSGAALLVLATTGTDRAGEARTVGAERVATRWAALTAGALLGANLFVRIDAVRELVLLVPLAAMLIGRRHPAGVPLVVGALVTGVPAALATTWWDSPYIDSVMSSLGPLLVAGSVLAVVSVAGVVLGRELEQRWRAGGPPVALVRVAGVLPGAAAALVAVVGLVLASRPLWLVDRREPYLPGMDTFIETLQAQQGLELDGLRTYAESTVTWLVWWLGPVTVVLALAAAVVLTRAGVRAVLARGPLPAWLLPFVVGLGVTVVSLYRPAITPDHPWSDRRYVTVTYPFVVLVATAAVAWLARWRHGRAGRWAPAAAVVLAVGMVVPTALATLPLATARTEVGQVDAAQDVCRALDDAGPDPAVLTVGFRGRVEWAPVVRGLCGVPLVGLEPPTTVATEEDLADVLARAAAGAREQGRTPVVLVGDEGSAQRVADATGVTPTRVVELGTTEPERLMEARPLTTRPLPVDAWVVPLP